MGTVDVDGPDDGQRTNNAGDNVPIIARKGMVNVGAHSWVVHVIHAAHVHDGGGRRASQSQKQLRQWWFA